MRHQSFARFSYDKGSKYRCRKTPIFYNIYHLTITFTGAHQSGGARKILRENPSPPNYLLTYGPLAGFLLDNLTPI